MAYVDSLTRGNRLALSKIAVHDSTPVQVQLLTGKEEQVERFLERFQTFPGFAGFNLNLSCPSPEVIRQGKGAAMIKRAAKTDRLTSIIRRHGYPVSVKIRLGTNAHEKAKKVYLNSLRGVDADFFIVHAKTASQDSSEPPDYSVYPECVDAADGKPIIANGDIDTP
jgi:tRNA-dihydrouridine synthase